MSLQCSAFSLHPLSAGKCLKIVGEILALRTRSPEILLMSKLLMFAVKSWWDEGGGRECSQPFPGSQTTTEAEDDFPEGIFPKPSLQPEAPWLHARRAVGGRVWEAPPALAACGDVGQRRAAAGRCSPGWTGCHGAHAVMVPHAPSRGFWRGAGSSGHIRSDVGDSARSRDGFPPPPAHHNCCSPPPMQKPSFRHSAGRSES